jgi:hypothetical protein
MATNHPIIVNISTYTPASAEEAAQLEQAAKEATMLNHMGLALGNAGNLAGSEAALLRAMDAKQRAYGHTPGDAAFGTGHNALGELYLRMGPARLADAELHLKRALTVRETLARQGHKHAFDAAITRENLARVEECRGDRDAARRQRKRGTMVCSNYNVRSICSYA